MIDTLYFAAKPAADCASIVLGKADHWTNNLQANGYLRKLRMAWAAYHGAYYTDVGTGHTITFGGDEGELAQLPINHLRNLCQHMLNMVCATRPTMEARSTNTDYKSLTQTILANGLLDYYMREKHLEKYLKTAVELAIVLGAGYVKMSWDGMAGEQYEQDEATNSPIYEGDIRYSNLTPFDVVVDSTKESQDHDWYIVRIWKNKFDLSAKYPELHDQIMAARTKSECNTMSISGFGRDETDDIAVWEFYHRKSESVPDGRYLCFVSEDAVLYDGPLPYRQIPIVRISPGDILGTPFGYGNSFDLLSLQEAVNHSASAIMSNQAAFAVQNILVPRGADVNISSLAGGLNLIEANTAAGEIRPLNLCQSSPETFQFFQLLEQQMETISGISSVSRGSPEASLKSGSALALVQSTSIQFMNGLMQSYVEMIERVGTMTILMLRDFAAIPRVAAIVGKGQRAYLKEFSGADLSSINRIVVDVGNPLARTTAGRVEMAKELLQMGAIKDANQYFTVINTGKLDVMFEGAQSELLLVKGENERLMDGQGGGVQVLALDDHMTHIHEHKSVLADPDLRQNPELVQAVLSHIQAHIEALRTTDPDLLKLTGQVPLTPPMPPGMMPPGAGPMPPGPPQGPPQGPPPGMPPGGPPPHGHQQGAPHQHGAHPHHGNPNHFHVSKHMLQHPSAPGEVPQIGGPGMPGMPHPPGNFANLPVDPKDAFPPR